MTYKTPYYGGHSDFGGRRTPPAKVTPSKDRSAVKRPRGSFRLSRWAGGRPPKGRPPAQRERPCNNEAGSEWSRRSCRGATGAVAPVAISLSAKQTVKIFMGPCYGAPALPMPVAWAVQGPHDTRSHHPVSGGVNRQKQAGGKGVGIPMEDSPGQGKSGGKPLDPLF
ncbi:hypothetical protein NDU88_001885 [Pleurodeles waltl]|uniref:Uncharacterized protein n=1 Tax=Pleurodeles waltl TaxID=8319 RepID=A0AAV7UX76_PLEWA|nr:hypothetical protein NDU88_001885 [Pleurodeles waltl]